MSKTRTKMRASALTIALTVIAGLAVACTPVTGEPGSPTWKAAGSAQQVYVTGVAPSTQMSLVNRAGTTIKTQHANSLGGLLFRDVPTGSGYKVRRDSDGQLSAAVTVHSNAAAPWDPDVYNQSIPDNGYSYLTTRDGTQLALTVHPPTSPAGEPGVPGDIKMPTLPASA